MSKQHGKGLSRQLLVNKGRTVNRVVARVCDNMYIYMNQHTHTATIWPEVKSDMRNPFQAFMQNSKLKF
jgi:hypothetical protein